MDGPSSIIRIDIEPVLDREGRHVHGQRGPRYCTKVNGEVICESTRLPVVDTCRLLAQRGVTGAFETWRLGVPYPCMRGVIERAATVTVLENRKVGLRFIRYAGYDA